MDDIQDGVSSTVPVNYIEVSYVYLEKHPYFPEKDKFAPMRTGDTPALVPQLAIHFYHDSNVQEPAISYIDPNY